jgi:hypothetical protein
MMLICLLFNQSMKFRTVDSHSADLTRRTWVLSELSRLFLLNTLELVRKGCNGGRRVFLAPDRSNKSDQFITSSSFSSS